MQRATNRQRIMDFLHKTGSITALEAVRDVHPPITALSQEIYRLEKEGLVFDHIRETGNGTHWTRYKLVEKVGQLALNV